MNKFIQEELQKLRVAALQQISENEFIIEQKKENSDLINLNSYYIIKIAQYILHPSENFTLASNWNKGVIPQSEYLKCMVTQKLGKMIKVDGCGYDFEKDKDLDDSYIGLWLPSGGIEIIRELG